MSGDAPGRRPVIAVIGSGDGVDEGTLALAATVGRLIAERGAALVTGGRGGTMEAASRGASEAAGRAGGDPRAPHRVSRC